MKEEGNIHIIGQGTYGCVYSPNIECETQKLGSKKFLSKIQRKDRTSKNEIIIGKKIVNNVKKTILYNRFAPILESCPVNIGKLEEDKITSCKMIVQEKNKVKKTGLISNKLHYVGKHTLGNYLESELLFKHHEKKQVEMYCKRLAETHLYLLKSTELLNNISVVHMDLKQNNIMFDDTSGVPVIIDFGLSYDTKHLDINKYITEEKKPFGIVAPYYMPWCIEIVLLSHIAYDISSKDRHVNEDKLNKQFNEVSKYQEICKTYIKKHFLLDEICNENEKKVYETGLMDWVKSWNGKSWREIWTLVANSYKTWDNYSLSIIYLLELSVSGLLKLQGNENSFIKRYVDILKKTIISKPGERATPDVTYKELYSIFTKTKREDYNHTIKKLVPYIKKNNQMIQEKRNKILLKTLQEEKRMHNISNK